MKRIAKLLIVVMIFTMIPTATVLAKTEESTAPLNLEVRVKYQNQNEYKIVRSLNVTYFASNSISEKYTFVDRLPTVAISDAKGVYISKILKDAGINLDDVTTIKFNTTDGGKKTFSKDALFADAYYYPGLADTTTWVSTNDAIQITNVSTATAGVKKVEPMISYEDDWYRLVNGPNGYSDESRYRLLLGMEDFSKNTNGYLLAPNASNSMKWISQIDVDVTIDDPDDDPIITPTPTHGAVNLVDIDNSWAKEYITNLCLIGAVVGNEKNQYLPKKNITRAEFASAFIKTLIKSDALVLDGSANLNDANNHWGKMYLSTAVKNNIIKPDSKGNVYPNRLITREEMATMIARGLSIENTGAVNAPTDVKKISTWALDSVYALMENGAISGYPDGSFKPQNKATKEESAKIIWGAVTNAGYTPKA